MTTYKHLINYLSQTESATTKVALDAILKEYYPQSTSFNSQVKIIFSKKMSTKRVLDILPKLYRLFKIYYPNTGSLSVKLSGIRKVIKANQSEESYKKSTYQEYFNLPESDRTNLKTAYKQKTIDKNNNQVQLNTTS